MNADRRVPGPLDTDTAPEAVGNGRSAALRNVQLERGYATTVRGNVAVGSLAALPAGTTRTVGICIEPDTNAVVYLVWHSAGSHALVRWLPGQAAPTALLVWEGLRLPARRGRTHATALDGLVIFLDADGAIRSVNLARAAAGEYTPALLAADPYALHLVKQPPRAIPAASRETNSTASDPRSQTNNVSSKAWQLAFQYEYRDGERTPLGPYSDVLLEARTLYAEQVPDPRNVIRVQYPAGDFAPSPLVKTVRLLVRAQRDNIWQVAGTLTAGQPFDFYGSTTGEALPTADAAKLAEAVPIAVGCLTAAHSTVMGGDCQDDYPLSWPETALTATAGPQPSVAGTAITLYQTETPYMVTYTGGDGNDRTEVRQRLLLWQRVSGTYPDPNSTYRQLQFVTGQYYPANDTATYTYQQAFEDFSQDELDAGIGVGTRTITVLTGTLAAAAVPTGSEATLHENSTYPVGVAFFDALGRTPGAEAVRSVSVPRQDYTQPAAQNIRWALDANVALPSWAYSYHLLLGQNRTSRFFLQFVAQDLKQYRGDKADGTPDLYAVDANGVFYAKALWISVDVLLKTGQGYVFEQGDQLRFPMIADGSAAGGTTFPILYQRAGYVAISSLAIRLFVGIAGGQLNSYQPLTEIYRPAELVESLVLYERGPRYPILNPGTPQAALSVTSGVIPGDCILVTTPGGYVVSIVGAMHPAVEVMNTSASHYDIWLDASRGRPIPRVPAALNMRRKNLVRFSGVKIAGSLLNGLSQWDALSQKTLPLESGACVALRLAAQGQSEGQTLIAIQERGAETLYLGQVPLSVANRQVQSQLVALTDAVIGGSNTLRGSYGTQYPGSVVGVNGRLFWWDGDQGEVCRYAADGVNPLNTQNECRQAGQAWAKAYAGAEIVAGYDPHTQEYVLCFGATGEHPALTVRYSERTDAPGFVGSVDYAPEALIGTSNTLYSVVDHQLWRHTDSAHRLTWYGRPAVPALASVWANAGVGQRKTWLSMVEEGGAPLWELVEATTPEGQRTMAPATRMVRDQGRWLGPLLLDANSPGFTGTDGPRRALYEGEPLCSTVLRATLECSDTTAAARLVALNLEFIINAG